MDTLNKSWWEGDPRVESLMGPVREAIGRYLPWPSPQYTDIYNRAYEAVYKAIIQFDKNPEPISESSAVNPLLRPEDLERLKPKRKRRKKRGSL